MTEMENPNEKLSAPFITRLWSICRPEERGRRPAQRRTSRVISRAKNQLGQRNNALMRAIAGLVVITTLLAGGTITACAGPDQGATPGPDTLSGTKNGEGIKLNPLATTKPIKRSSQGSLRATAQTQLVPHDIANPTRSADFERGERTTDRLQNRPEMQARPENLRTSLPKPRPTAALSTAHGTEATERNDQSTGQSRDPEKGRADSPVDPAAEVMNPRSFIKSLTEQERQCLPKHVRDDKEMIALMDTVTEREANRIRNCVGEDARQDLYVLTARDTGLIDRELKCVWRGVSVLEDAEHGAIEYETAGELTPQEYAIAVAAITSYCTRGRVGTLISGSNKANLEQRDRNILACMVEWTGGPTRFALSHLWHNRLLREFDEANRGEGPCSDPD